MYADLGLHSFPSDLIFPQPPSISFEGYEDKAFQALSAIRVAPHIDTYRPLKPTIKEFITEPFKRYRDDLVVNWVLPNQLPLETERNVFSRLLKNDYGAGGCHHHLWMAFYRDGLRRLRDLQLAHTIRDTGCSTSLFIGDNAPVLFNAIKQQVFAQPETFVRLVNLLLKDEKWVFKIRPHKSASGSHLEYASGITGIPDELEHARGFWFHTFHPKDTILRQGEKHIRFTLGAINALWPLYLFLLNESQ